jgi:hypothetical protein
MEGVLLTRRSTLIVGLALALLATLGFGATGCGVDQMQARAELMAALTEFNLEAAPLGAMVMATDASATTTPEGVTVKAAVERGIGDVGDEWQAVVGKAKRVDGAKADAEAGEAAWAALEVAAGTLPEGATAGEARVIVAGPLNEVLAVSGRLNSLAAGLD